MYTVTHARSLNCGNNRRRNRVLGYAESYRHLNLRVLTVPWMCQTELISVGNFSLKILLFMFAFQNGYSLGQVDCGDVDCVTP